MPDPISMVASVGAIAKLAYSCRTGLYTFITQTTAVDNNVQALHDEVNHLAETSTVVESVLTKPGLDAFHNVDLWPKAKASVDACSISLNKLHASIPEPQASRSKPKSLFGKVYAQIKLEIKLHMSTAQIISMRQQV